jgi:heme exporter protein B
MTLMSILRQVIEMTRKDLLIEWRSPSRVSALFFFALAILLIVAFASPSTALLPRMAGGTLWLGLLLSSTRALDQSYAVETEQGALEGLLLWPVHPVAIYLGKAIANTLLLLAVAFALTPLLIALYDAPITESLWLYVAFVFFGCGAIAAPGTMYAMITARARGASVLLPLLLLPLVMPALLAASRGTALLIEGDPMNQATSWLGLLVAFNAIHFSLASLLYSRLIEDS